MQQIALEFPAYYRRITAELRRRGFQVNHKRVLRLMRPDNLLCLRHKSFVVTTDSRHSLAVYPNLAREITPSAANQLWVADITYIRLRREFVYLAVLLNAYSRRVIGWALGRTLEAELTLSALRMALRQRRPAAGLVHHSDRGVQYGCGAPRTPIRATPGATGREFHQNAQILAAQEVSRAYTDLLKQHTISSSMSRTAPTTTPRPRVSSKRSNMRRSTEPNIETWGMPTHRLVNSSNACTTKNGSTRHWVMCPRPSSSSRRGKYNEAAARRHAWMGALPPNPRDLSPWGQNGSFWRRPEPPPAIPATESALGLRPRSALSSAQVLPEWITSTSPCNTFAANGDYPLN